MNKNNIVPLLQIPQGRPVPFMCPEMPQWMRTAVLGNTEEFDDSFDRHQGKEHADCGGAPMMPTEPHYRGAAVAVQRFGTMSNASDGSQTAMSAEDFFFRAAFPGLPVVIEGALPSGTPAWRARVAAIGECLADEYASKAAAHGFVSNDACDRYHGWCSDGVQISSSERCRSLAGLVPGEVLPTGLQKLLELPAPLPPLEATLRSFHEPFLLWTPPGGTFGSANHFDQICGATLSMQHQGVKKWSLWAPWDVYGDGRSPTPSDERGRAGVGGARQDAPFRAHTRFEATLRPGDMLFYPPACKGSG